MKYSNYKRKKGFFAGKGFYIVLACCVLAVGVAAFAAVSTIEQRAQPLAESSSSKEELIKPQSSTVENVGQTVSDVPASSSEPVSSEEEKEEPKAPAFAMPLKCNIGKIFSSTELQYSATYKDMRLHLGVDLQAKKGTRVAACAAGDVLSVSSDALWGKMVTIDHGNGIVIYYCGLENTTVSKGESVSAGTVIGEVGTVPCESADIEHIHISVTRDGKYISPLDLLK